MYNQEFRLREGLPFRSHTNEFDCSFCLGGCPHLTQIRWQDSREGLIYFTGVHLMGCPAMDCGPVIREAFPEMQDYVLVVSVQEVSVVKETLGDKFQEIFKAPQVRFDGVARELLRVKFWHAEFLPDIEPHSTCQESQVRSSGVEAG